MLLDKLQKFCVISLTQGGAHASNNVDIQEFMILPVGAKSFKEGLRWCSEVYHCLKGLLKERNLSVAVGDEGGFAPDLESEEQVLDIIVEAVEKSGFQKGKDFKISLDVISKWFVGSSRIRKFASESINFAKETRPLSPPLKSRCGKI